MASIDQLIGGSFESLGLPRLSPSEQLQWLESYSAANPTLSAYKSAASAPAAAQPSAPMVSAYAPQQSQSPAAAAATTAAGQGPQVNSVTGKMGFNPLFGSPANSVLSMLGGGKLQLPQAGNGLLGLLGGFLGGLKGGGPTGLPRMSRQTPSQAYRDRNIMAGMAAIENSSLSAESKARTARSRSGGDSHGLTSNGNPGWWGS